MRRESAAIKIHKESRRYLAKKAYTHLRISVLAIQTGLRAMASRNEFRFRKQTRGAIMIQVTMR